MTNAPRLLLSLVAGLVVVACGQAPSEPIDPAYLNAILEMEREACHCANEVPRDQVEQCMSARRASLPGAPGGGDIMDYLETLRPEDRRQLDESAVRREACLDAIRATAQ